MNSKRIVSLSVACAFALAVFAACTSDSAKAKVNFVYKDAPKPGIVAKINGEEITEDQLIGDAQLELMQIKKQEYDLKIGQLNKMVQDKVLGAEAKKEGIATTDEFIAKKITKGDIKISDSEYKKFVKEKNIPESNINDQVKERIYSYMKEQKRDDMVQAYVAKLTKNSPIEVYFKKPKSNIQVDIGQAPIEGGESAKVTIVEFSDFQCPFCGRAAKTVQEVHKKYGNKVRIAFKHFPLPMHKDAGPASEASMCVFDQGKDKFWKFHDIAFANQDKLDSENLAKHAKAAGADEKKFKECFDGHKYADFVKKDQAYGEKLGVRSTPTFFINGQLLSGALPIEAFSEVIDDELATAK
ncbi:MAG: thioredoxin domain-containing protein [Bdellovibrionales bacterium]|nr:thioredoxin domain-containing protein [Bdellovibrionales bacterium]